VSTTETVRPRPLSPLTPDECAQATQILKDERSLTSDFRFVFIDIKEPDKPALAGWPEHGIDRRVAIVGFERSTLTVIEAVVSLDEETVVSFEPVPGAQPPLMREEWEQVDPILKADPRWQAAMHRRGITDFEYVHIDPWAGSPVAPEDIRAGRRICRPLAYARRSASGQAYAHPIDGLTCVFDLGTMTVVDVIDHEVIPVPTETGEYVPELMLEATANRPRYTELRADVKPIAITEPEGPSWQVDGHRVEWQKWSVQLGWTMREGLVLSDITYDDRGTVRPILHRAAISEMVVPYGDPAPTQFRKLAFDAGEDGLGHGANSLTLGCDCLGEIRYFDGLTIDQDGNPFVIKNAICMHEEDVGVGWTHRDQRGGTTETRRMQRLVLSFIANVGNYEYGFFWYLYQDGSIELEAKLNGIMNTGALRSGETPQYGVKIAPHLYGPNHQHFFCVRLDTTVDGPDNTVTEVDSVPVPVGPQNPYGNGWVAKETPLRTELEARRELNSDTARFWRITNPNQINDLGRPTAYRLVPGANARLMHDKDSAIFQRIAFASKHLWVTPASQDELYAGGDYPWQNPGPMGLPLWTEADRSIENTDIAVWYVFGAHHVPRVEEWPVMPVDHIGFQLKPDGFFDGNPALDLPRPAAHEHCDDDHCAGGH
jgi:primary-amine oxidase